MTGRRLFPPYCKLLYSATALAATANSGAVELPADIDGALFIVDTGTITGTSPTYDVAYQVTPDDGTNWYTVARHAQITSTGKRYMALSFNRTLTAGAEGAIADTGGALNANVPFSSKLRVLVTITGTNPSASAFKVWMIAQRATLQGM